MERSTLTTQATRILSQGGPDRAEGGWVLPDLLLLRHRGPTPTAPTLYEPVVCLILQGRKETVLGDETTRLGPGDALVVSHDVPVSSRITGARPDEPYLALILRLELSLLRSLEDEVGPAPSERGAAPTRAMAAHRAAPELLDALGRYLSLAERPTEAKVLGPLVKKEIHFRLLTSEGGAMLRSLLRRDSHASHVARAIARIRRDYRTSIVVPELAREVGMSPSALHKHFRAVTSTTPLGYQKELRLLEARRLLRAGQHSVSSAAYEVGYESPSQFSREYARKYGVPPRDDLRAAADASA